MNWMRNYSRKLLGPYLPKLSTEQAQKYMALSRMTYFFSAGALFIIIYNESKKATQYSLELGKPVLIDHSPAHEKFRRSNLDRGVIHEYVVGKGMKTTELTKEEYYKILEEEALERSKEAQRKLLAEGKELPEGALRLVD